MDSVVNSAAFQRAFVAVSYFLNRRGEELLAPLPQKTQAAVALAKSLGHEAREQRAQALAGEIARIVAALESARAF
ncbi:MAG TPA: hypothetical protein VFQ35_14925 [Polyangiaceae bacterium]|nr:hypothetical protein [Polyangiaceae bacterium]